MKTINSDRLRECLDYDPDTGTFYWKITGGPRRLGKVAGTIGSKGYVVIGIDGVKHSAHRLAYVFMTGENADNMLDHINGDRADNRWANLRCVTRAVNANNQRQAQADNRSSGLLGVSRHRTGKWQARIKKDGRNHYLGLHPTKEAAAEVYLAAKRRMHPGCTI